MTTFGYEIDTRPLFFFCSSRVWNWNSNGIRNGIRNDIDRIRIALEAMLTYFVACDRGAVNKILLFIGFIIGFHKIQLIRRRKTP